ncbi:MAG TPA: HIT domain-containing protein [Bacillota bacterium]|nr:HIT domain-containing protein [Bacillota bacterium]
MEECIFCKIVKGEIPSEKVWEDSEFISFLDAKPRIKGHTLIIPKKHFNTLMDLEDDISKKYIGAIKKTGKILMEKYNAGGFNVVLNNGKVAGQIINHIHFHLVPRKKGDKKQLDLVNIE